MSEAAALVWGGVVEGGGERKAAALKMGCECRMGPAGCDCEFNKAWLWGGSLSFTLGTKLCTDVAKPDKISHWGNRQRLKWFINKVIILK